jgi:hypothetical protein
MADNRVGEPAGQLAGLDGRAVRGERRRAQPRYREAIGFHRPPAVLDAEFPLFGHGRVQPGDLRVVAGQPH